MNIETLVKLFPTIKLDYLTLWWYNNGQLEKCISPPRDSKLDIPVKQWMNESENNRRKFKLQGNQFFVAYEDIPITTLNKRIQISPRRLDLEMILSINPLCPKTNTSVKRRELSW